MMRTRRQRQQYMFMALLTAVGIVNLLFFLILFRPARSEYFRLVSSTETFRSETEMRRQSMDRLEKLSAQLDTYEQDRQQLVTGHFVPYDIWASEIPPKLDTMAERAGVRKSRVAYSPAEAPQYGLHSIKITIPVEGGYSNVVRFIRELENSDTFFIIEAIDVRSASESNTAASNEIALSLSLETFSYR